MLDRRTLTHAQLAAIVVDVPAILWKESRLLPDFPREYGEYWNLAKEWEPEHIELIAETLDEAGLKPPDFMPVAEPEDAPAPVIDANELLWAARVLASLVRVHRNVIPAVRENVKLAEAILSHASRQRLGQDPLVRRTNAVLAASVSQTENARGEVSLDP